MMVPNNPESESSSSSDLPRNRKYRKRKNIIGVPDLRADIFASLTRGIVSSEDVQEELAEKQNRKPPASDF